MTGVAEAENVLRPLGQRIIVRRLSERERSGILIPEAVKKSTLVGAVVHVGPDADWVKPGDVILYALYSTWQFPIDGKYIPHRYDEHLIMNAEDCMVVIEAPDSKNGGEPA